MHDEYVLATILPPRIFNFYATRQSAEADTARANLRGAVYGDTHTPMWYEDYKAAERSFYLDHPADAITAEAFEEHLGVLPPLHYGRHAGLTSFLMSEFWSGPYTHQYAAADGRYWCKMVDATDRGTWMTLASVTAP